MEPTANTQLPLKKKNVKEGSFPFFDRIRELYEQLPIPQAKDFLRKINIYRKMRESLVSFYLKRTVAAEKKDLDITWQPPLFVLAKIGIAAYISLFVYNLHTYVGEWFKIGFEFFKLHEIYNFKFPSQSFFNSIAGYLFLFIIAYHGIYFLYHQIQAFFSVLVINKADEKVYYIRNFFIKKDLFVFSVPDIALVMLKQNIVSRLFGLGTVSLQKRSGEQVTIRTVQRVHSFLKELTVIKKPYGENAGNI